MVSVWFVVFGSQKGSARFRATPAVAERTPVVVTPEATGELSTDTLKVCAMQFTLGLSEVDIEMTGGCTVLPAFLHTFQLQKRSIEIAWSMTPKSTIARKSTVQAERLALIFYFKAF